MTTPANLLLASLPFLISDYVNLFRKNDKREFLQEKPDGFNLPRRQEFDFIIVGAGTAGSIVAYRLSEKYKVLVLEAGGDLPPIQYVPAVSGFTATLPEINFLFQSVPQKNLQLQNNGTVVLTFGKMLGGSNAHNNLIWERGSPKDYDYWAKVTRDSSWKYANLQQYFRKIENYHDVVPARYDERGFRGKVFIEEDNFKLDQAIFVKAAEELNFKLYDTSRSQISGVKLMNFVKRNGARETTYTAYLKPVENRTSLRLYKYSWASEVLFDNKKAVGVKYTRHGIPQVAFARKEVILCAGPVVTSMILIKSGIGPADQIEIAKVDPVSILPVGKRLNSQTLVVTPSFSVDPQYSWNLKTNLTYDDVEDFELNRKGPLTASASGNVRVMLATSQSGDPTWPDIQFKCLYSGSGNNTIAIQIETTRTRSVGTLKLNPEATFIGADNLPLLDFNSYSDERDLKATIEGMEVALKMFNTTVFRNIGITPPTNGLKNCQEFVFPSRNYLECYIRQTATANQHINSMCRMGYGMEDKMAVVDSELRVLGVKNLRVIDQSVLPSLNSNTMGAVMVVAEKGSCMIMKTHGANVNC